MQVILEESDKLVLRFEKGEEVIFALGEFLKNHEIDACVFNAIGASNQLELGSYVSESKTFEKKEFSEDLEILVFNGNGSLKEGKHFIHAHGVFGRTDFSTLGGHVYKMTISATCEMLLTKLRGEMTRLYNPKVNLHLLN